jgi:predicted Mrr-cat superfamily restriction endonuclease
MNVYQMKTKPNGVERVQDFLRDGFVCIGWAKLGDLTGVTRSDIRQRLVSEYGLDGHRLGNALGQVNTFVNVMQEGDVVLVKEGEHVHIGVVGAYHYDSAFDNETDAMCHRRNTQWLGSVKLEELNASVQRIMANMNTICRYRLPFEESGLGLYVNVYRPIPNLSRSTIDRSRLDSLVEEALKVLGEELRSEDPDRRLRAATELVRLKRR